MRVLLVSNSIDPVTGGAQTVLADTRRLLRDRGHEVIDFTILRGAGEGEEPAPHLPRWEDLAKNPWRLRGSLATVYSYEVRDKLSRLVAQVRPDVAHLHNVYEKLTLSVVDALTDLRVPSVLTLHDYRAVCANGRLWDGSGVCEACLAGGSFLPAVLRRCHLGSALRTAVAATEAALNRRRTLYRRVSLLVAPSAFLAHKVSALEHPRIRVVPNPVDTHPFHGRPWPRRPRFVFAGRLVAEKGIDVLMDAASRITAPVVIEIVGDGRERARLQEAAGRLSKMEFVGYEPRHRLRRRLGTSTAALVPSVWYENCPLAILEAGSVGTPVIASDLGAMRELVGHDRDGVLVPPGDAAALAAAIDRLAGDPTTAERLGGAARQRVASQNAPAGYIAAITDCYRDAIALESAA